MKEAQERIGKQSLKELSQENTIKGDISMQQRTNYNFWKFGSIIMCFVALIREKLLSDFDINNTWFNILI